MNLLHPDADQIVRIYLKGEAPQAALGSGLDGIVYSTPWATAVKIHSRRQTYDRELAVYQRLKACAVHSVCGLAVPRLIQWHDELRVIEMSIVRPPYILDFAKSTLDLPIDFGPEVLDDWRRRVIEEFEEHWQTAMGIYDELRDRYGIYHLDLSPRNVNFGNE